MFSLTIAVLRQLAPLRASDGSVPDAVQASVARSVYREFGRLYRKSKREDAAAWIDVGGEA